MIDSDRDVARFNTHLNLAKSGNLESMFKLAEIFSMGIGCNESKENSVKWLKESAQKGHPEGGYQLGIAYLKGYDVDQSYKEAMAWLKQSSDMGNPKAMKAVGDLYQGNDDIDQNWIEAYKYYIMAHCMGYKISQTVQESLTFNMTPAQIKTSQGLATECLSKIQSYNKP